MITCSLRHQIAPNQVEAFGTYATYCLAERLAPGQDPSVSDHGHAPEFLTYKMGAL